ncbi:MULTISPECIES: aldo/keto reductase [unclassified Paenibacillus]|uniref:aldo/keto reductase n=1 Tax=unclassified Paenibacillus TaxID=185978 RepID=UPI002406EF3F|nr:MULTISPECIES: aldo/keto reductase [unclassified Paenibacillus]MDF9850941.1 putative oxidoreductase [Paenibacillus sp. PastM-2]MDH6482779.1 putative oxidoreductase [Paenibacillus sp. PastH-2]MDH6510205.1 putative oxidoreductase [Paenibacillus sp. PastM-3]MDF9844270.1 putative oxidoreductase [Paenibacillus sp. PastF-2]MDF9857445.1 putative oxidoreductase [Paenibacillus sp. PastF-1]
MVNKIKAGSSQLEVAEISLGCMRIAELSPQEADVHIHSAVEAGIDFFDHADIYAGGKAEEVFGDVVAASPGMRDQLLIQTKCGIRDGFFDFSRDHIVQSVENSLKRLKTDYVDVLLLHRPDTLMEPEEVAEAFDYLEQKGMVKHFGVSNLNPLQIELLKKNVKQPLLFNQLQLSIMVSGMIDAGFNVNMTNSASVVHDGGILEYSRLHDMTIQPWSPFQYGFFEGVFLGNDKFPELNEVIDRLAAEKGVADTAIAIAWLLRHPASMQPIVGTTNTQRLLDIAKASDITLTRQEWYEIYRAAGNKLP